MVSNQSKNPNPHADKRRAVYMPTAPQVEYLHQESTRLCISASELLRRIVDAYRPL